MQPLLMRFRELRRAIHQNEGTVVDPNVSAVRKDRNWTADVRQIIGRTVSLFQQQVSVQPIPCTIPVFIGPANAERRVGLATFQDVVHGTFKNAPPIKPIMVIAKATDAMVERKFGLGSAFPAVASYKIPNRWEGGLVMARKPGCGFHDIGPFCETFTPLVVLGVGWNWGRYKAIARTTSLAETC
jgi:hypothetical protein